MGYGTDGPKNCVCTECNTGKDHDIRGGRDDREGVFEHVFFKDPHTMMTKAIENGK